MRPSMMAVNQWAALFGLFIATNGVALGQTESKKPTNDGSARVKALIASREREAVQFRTALETIARQAQVTILAEGIPLHFASEASVFLTHDSGQAEAILAEPINTDSSTPTLTMEAAEDRVRRLAEAYDYTLVRQAHLFLLKKRYTAHQDLPELTIGEISAALAAVYRVMKPFNPQIKEPMSGFNATQRALIDSLTPEQKQAAQTGIAMSELTSAQQANLYRLALRYYIQLPAEDIYCALTEAQQLQKPTTILRRARGKESVSDDRPDAMIGYDDLTGWFGGPLFRLMTQEGAGALPEPPVSADDIAAAESGVRLRQQLGATSIKVMIDTLNRRVKTGTPTTIDTTVADTTLLAYGLEQTPPSEILSGLNELCGLQVQTRTDGSQILMRPAPVQPRRLEELPEATRRVIPPSLIRALHVDDLDAEAAMTKEQREKSWRPRPGQKKDMFKQFFQHGEWKKRTTQFYTEAVHRLRLDFALNQKKKAGHITPSDLTTEGRSDLALLTMVSSSFDAGNALQNLLRHSPPIYIKELPRLGLITGQYVDEKGRQKDRLFLGIQMADGKWQPTVGYTYTIETTSSETPPRTLR